MEMTEESWATTDVMGVKRHLADLHNGISHISAVCRGPGVTTANAPTTLSHARHIAADYPM